MTRTPSVDSTDQPPAPPEGMDLDTQWTALTPVGVAANIHLWEDRSARAAEIRLRDGALLGTVTATGAGPSLVLNLVLDTVAVAEHGEDWVTSQLRHAKFRLAHKWGKVSATREREATT